jgi:hypothetical protein
VVIAPAAASPPTKRRRERSKVFDIAKLLC